MEQEIADARGNGKGAQTLRSSARVELFSGMILTNAFDSGLTSFPCDRFYIVFPLHCSLESANTYLQILDSHQISFKFSINRNIWNYVVLQF